MCVAPKAHITSIGKKVQPPLIYVMAVICMQLALILPAQNYWLTHHKWHAACTQIAGSLHGDYIYQYPFRKRVTKSALTAISPLLGPS